MKKILLVLILCIIAVSSVIIFPSCSTGKLNYRLNDDNTYAVIGMDDKDNITNIKIPSEYEGLPVTTISYKAFSYCKKLNSVKIPESIITIDDRAFEGCKKIKSMKIPESVIEIGAYTFSHCTGLTEINIPDSVKTIYDNTFYGCYNLIKTENNVKYVDKWIVGCDNNPTSITIKNDTKGIAAYAFRQCDNLSSLTIPDSVRVIGYFAFDGCNKLTEAIIGSGVSYFGPEPFYDCFSLKNIYYSGNVAGWCDIEGLELFVLADYNLYINGTKIAGELVIPNGVTSIGAAAFRYCKELSDVTLPNSITYIGDRAFSGCSMLTTIKYDGTISNWDAINKHSNWDLHTHNYTIVCTDGVITVD